MTEALDRDDPDLAGDLRFERSLPWRELVAVLVVVAVVVARQLWFA